jgi:hypothetical protein
MNNQPVDLVSAALRCVALALVLSMMAVMASIELPKLMIIAPLAALVLCKRLRP